MTIAILKLEAGQKIARPFARACDVAELVELVAGNIAALDCAKRGGSALAQIRAQQAFSSHAEFVKTLNVDTETPIASVLGVTFYAFREA